MTLSRSTLLSLAAMPDRLSDAIAAFPADRLAFTPPSWEGIPGERFSPIGQLCHVRDIEVEGYQVRIARMLDEEAPALVSLDSYALAEGRGYDAADPQAVLAAVRAARSRTLALLEPLGDEPLCRRGSFGGYGELSLRSLVHYLASHDLQHLACLEWLLGQVHAG